MAAAVVMDVYVGGFSVASLVGLFWFATLFHKRRLIRDNDVRDLTVQVWRRRGEGEGEHATRVRARACPV